MVVYVEYALAENFLLDGVLLYLSLRASRRKVRSLLLCIAAAVGAVFAVVYPLLSLPFFVSQAGKALAGIVVCKIAFGRAKTKKQRGMYALNCVFFFALTALYGGALLAFGAVGAWVLLGFALLTAFCLVFISKMQQTRALSRYLYACELYFGDKSVEALGFLDSGNRAQKHGIPVCFLTPELAFSLLEDAMFTNPDGQVCDEMAITTLSGEKRARLFKGSLKIKRDGQSLRKEVYFSFSANMVNREYALLLSAYIFETNE